MTAFLVGVIVGAFFAHVGCWLDHAEQIKAHRRCNEVDSDGTCCHTPQCKDIA